MREQRFSGIVISSKAIFEKDKRIDLFTQGHGRKSFIVKRAQVKPYPYSGALEPLNQIEIESYQGKSMAYVKQCSLNQSFSHIRTHFNSLSIAGYILDILKKATHPDQENPALFTMVIATLSELNTIAKNKQGDKLELFQHRFENQFLVCEGLSDTETALAHPQFREQFYHYTGHLITPPTLLNGIMSK